MADEIREKGRGRVLNLHDRRAGVPELILCPRCEGQAFDKGSCGMCGNVGYLRSYDGERLDFVEMVQILATFALATEMDVAPKPPVAGIEQPLKRVSEHLGYCPHSTAEDHGFVLPAQRGGGGFGFRSCENPTRYLLLRPDNGLGYGICEACIEDFDFWKERDESRSA